MTNELRELIRIKLKTILSCEVYYQLADDNAMYPHAVVSLDSMNTLPDDLHRRDYELTVDYYTRDAVEAEEAGDMIRELFAFENMPTDNILPTAYVETVRNIIDEDKTVRHKQIVATVSTYKR